MNVTVLTAIGDPRREAELAAGLSDVDLGVTVVRRCVDLPDLLAAAAAGLAQVAVLSADLRRLDRAAVRRLADAGVTVVGLASDDQAVQERLRSLGVARLVIDSTPTKGVAAALVDAAAGRDDGASTQLPGGDGGGDTVDAGTDHGQVVAVWGPPGAPGRSTIALNLAAELAGLGQDVVCIDLDTYAASLGQLAGLLDEGSGVAVACRHANNGRLDAAALRELAEVVRPGLGLLTGIGSPLRWPELRPSAIESLLGVSRAAYAFTVIDVGSCVEQDEDLAYDTVAPRRNGAAITVLGAADIVIAVGGADPVGIARLARSIDGLPGEADPIAVLNRVRPGVVGRRVVGRGDVAREITDALRRHVQVTDVVTVPEDAATADAALLAGRTWAEVSTGSPARVAIRALAQRLAGVSDRHRSSRRRRLL